MSVAPEEFLPYINGALDGMVQIVEALGDERVNLRPNNMANTNSPFAILTHCVGLTRCFMGALGTPGAATATQNLRPGTVARSGRRYARNRTFKKISNVR